MRKGRVVGDHDDGLAVAIQFLQDVGDELNYVRQSLLAGPELEKIAVDSGVLPANVTDVKVKSRILRDMGSRVVLTVHGAGDHGGDARLRPR